jgi:hypothetical protein
MMSSRSTSRSTTTPTSSTRDRSARRRPRAIRGRRRPNRVPLCDGGTSWETISGLVVGVISGRPTIADVESGYAYFATDVSGGTLYIAKADLSGWYTVSSRSLPTFSAVPANSTGTIPHASSGLGFAGAGKVTLGTQEWDDAEWYDPSTSRFTPGTAGVYRLTGMLSLASNVAASNVVGLAVFKNGALMKPLAYLSEPASGDLPTIGGSVNGIANGTSDYFELFAYQNSGVSKTVAAVGTYFQGELVRPA